MRLDAILDACQYERIDHWRLVPLSEPAEVVPIDADSDQKTNDGFLYRAEYISDARLGIAWGLRFDEENTSTADMGRPPASSSRPDWADPSWRDTKPQWAHLELRSTCAWRVTYAYINRGAGRDAYFPWPVPELDRVPPGDISLRSRRVGWTTTKWEMEFAKLIGGLQGNAWDFDFERERRGFGLRVEDVSPFNAGRLDRVF